MRIQVLFAGVILLASPAMASLPAQSDCYDFGREIREAPANRKAVRLSEGSRASGELPTGVVWAAVEDRSPKSLPSILSELATHEKTKSGRVDDMEIAELGDPQFLRHQKVKFVVNPFPLISIKWTEDWAFTVLSGTKEKPESVLVVYEKTDGTSHIGHLCGAYELHALPSGKTAIFLYEEAKATSRSREDTLNGLTSTLSQFH